MFFFNRCFHFPKILTPSILSCFADMTSCTRFEDLPTDLFFEIFDYLDAFEIFTSFNSLNQRISSILQSIPLRIYISANAFRSQVDFLSSQLIFHEHQVISITISDTIRDDSAIISLFFRRHNFLNLQFCSLLSVDFNTKIDRLLEKIKTYRKLLIFNLFNHRHEDLPLTSKSQLLSILLKHQSPLRSINVYYPYNYFDLKSDIPANLNLVSIGLRMAGISSASCFLSIRTIFRICQRIKYIQLAVELTDKFETNQKTNLNGSSLMDQNDLPVLTQVESLYLVITNICGIKFVELVLRCLPNLMWFALFYSFRTSRLRFPKNFINGIVWKRMFEQHLTHLKLFEFFMFIQNRKLPNLRLEQVVGSFDYFVETYSNWHMIIDRWRVNIPFEGEVVMLRTINHHKFLGDYQIKCPMIQTGAFETASTKHVDDHWMFYPNTKAFDLYLTNEKAKITWSSCLFKGVEHLRIEMPVEHSWWENLYNIGKIFLSSIRNSSFGLISVRFSQSRHNFNDVQSCINDISHFIHLSKLAEIEFGSSVGVSRWKHVELILQ
ncbi:unnamed protein product [Adineta ricciae]|uniref:F-box domain-containing protein n=1 Tax=Adineta ricciae TaxID=249248 RepID=A0A816EJE4_ADIRI|nr:unnamed protein product [Adineta ricciae]